MFVVFKVWINLFVLNNVLLRIYTCKTYSNIFAKSDSEGFYDIFKKKLQISNHRYTMRTVQIQTQQVVWPEEVFILKFSLS